MTDDHSDGPAGGGFTWGLASRTPGESPTVGRTTAEPAAAEPANQSSEVNDSSAASVDEPPPLVVPPSGVIPPPAAAPFSTELPAGDVHGDAGPPTVAMPNPFALSEPQPFDGSLAGGPSPEAEPHTMAMPWESAGTELFAPIAASSPVAEPATELLSGFETTPPDAAAGSSIDALFGESQFREYETSPVLAVQGSIFRTSVSAADNAVRQRPRRAPLSRSQKVLLWIAGCLAAILILIGLFILGTKLPSAGAAPVAAPSATPTPTPSATPMPAPTGPITPGTYKWNLLRGGECLSPFDSLWAEEFTVVDCATPHPAQLISRGTIAPPPPAATDPSAPVTDAATEQGASATESTYPGVEALQAQVRKLCHTPKLINFKAAGAYRDVLVSASYPADEEQWAEGDHDYFCFVSRSSGDPLKGSLSTIPSK